MHWDFDIVSDFYDDFKALSFRIGNQYLVPACAG
jgi:hypothetical protein